MPAFHLTPLQGYSHPDKLLSNKANSVAEACTHTHTYTHAYHTLYNEFMLEWLSEHKSSNSNFMFSKILLEASKVYTCSLENILRWQASTSCCSALRDPAWVLEIHSWHTHKQVQNKVATICRLWKETMWCWSAAERNLLSRCQRHVLCHSEGKVYSQCQLISLQLTAL